MATREAPMRSKERVRGIAHEILAAFESGELPKELAKLFISRNIEVPSKHWTWTNRLIGIRKGHVYAAGFRQWEEMGRHVKRGQHGFHILAPRIVRAKEDNEERGVKEGDLMSMSFQAIPVFGYLQTEGEPLPGAEDEPAFVESLPLIEVARSWGLTVETYSLMDAPDRLGFYAPGRGIGLGVRNLGTWAHELLHAADHRLGNLVVRSLDAEVVAEFGGAVLLECLGYTGESDRGGAYEYLKRYAAREKRNLLGACSELLDRTCSSVALILESAEALTGEASGSAMPSVAPAEVAAFA